MIALLKKIVLNKNSTLDGLNSRLGNWLIGSLFPAHFETPAKQINHTRIRIHNSQLNYFLASKAL